MENIGKTIIKLIIYYYLLLLSLIVKTRLTQGELISFNILIRKYKQLFLGSHK